MRTIRERCASGVKILAMKSIFSRLQPVASRGHFDQRISLAGRSTGAYRTQCLWQTAGTYSRPFRRAGRSELYATGSGRAEAAALQRPGRAISLSRRTDPPDQRRPPPGAVVLRQGRWNAAAHTVLTCEGQTVTPDLDSRALAHIERRQSHASAAVSIAWLEAPEGSQLLLVANENFCTWQPTEKSF